MQRGAEILGYAKPFSNADAIAAARSQTKQAEENEKGGNPIDNVKRVSGDGNSQSYTLRRLIRAGREDLLAEIEAGTLSANAAAIQAGFRKPPRESAAHSL